jgi:superfamily I DNA and/or RNA helicase
VIAPYRAQVEMLKHYVEQSKENWPEMTEVEVNTVDQYQGRDKNVSF